jgi:hypothetical protein
MSAFFYKANGTISTPRPAVGDQFSVKELQDLMGGYLFEIIDLDDNHPNQCKKIGLPSGTILVCNDNKHGQELNAKVSTRVGQPFYGDILMCDGRLVPRNAEADQLRGVMPHKTEKQLRKLTTTNITCPKCNEMFIPTLADIYGKEKK